MTITALSDAELLRQARGGDEAAFTELYVRHQAAARRLASTYKRMGDPDDLVNGAFERVLGALRRGAGPTESFRAYLFVTLRRLAAEQGQKPADRPIDEVPEPVSDEADAPELAAADRDLITTAFESLPDRWQAVLWHTAVEGRRPQELASVMGVSANAAAALAYRAREKLRQAYLQAHLQAAPAPEHKPYRSQLGAYVRDGLSARDKAAVERHLEGCGSCRALVAELEDINRVLVRSMVPLFLLAGGGKLAIAAAGAAAAGGKASSGPSSSHGGGLVNRGARKLRRLAPTAGNVAAIVAVVAATVGIGAVVARNSSGPLDTAADAADIGPTGIAGTDAGSGGAGGAGGGSGAGSGLFGAPDGTIGAPALGPSGGGARLGDNGVSGGTAGSAPFAAAGVPLPSPPPAATSPSAPPSPSTPPAPPSGQGTTPSTPPGGGGGGSPPEPQPPPAPAALEFSASAWTPTAVGRGDLTVTIGERDGSAATAAAAAPAATDPLRLQVTLTPGARAFPGAALDGRCTDSGPTISCTLTQPPAGGSVRFSLPLQVDAAGQTASLTLFRGTAVEATIPAAVPLTLFEQGLDLTEPVWAPFPGIGGPAPAGRLTVGAINRGGHAMPSPTLTVTIAGDGGFVPPTIFAHLLPTDLVERLPLPAALRQQLLAEIATPLPPGCSVVGWTPPAGGGASWAATLRGGLPTTMRCELGDMAPGAEVSLGGMLVAVRPLYVHGDGRPEDPTAEVTLRLGDTVVAGPRTVELVTPRPVG